MSGGAGLSAICWRCTRRFITSSAPISSSSSSSSSAFIAAPRYRSLSTRAARQHQPFTGANIRLQHTKSTHLDTTYNPRRKIASARTPTPTPASKSKSKVRPKQQHPSGSSVTSSSTSSSATSGPAPLEYDYIPTSSLYSYTLARRGSPTVLFTAPESRIFPYTCAFVSASLLTYGGWHFYDAYLVAHPGLNWIVPHMILCVSAFTIGSGLWVGAGARRHIQSIAAVPVQQSLVAATRPRRGGALGGSASSAAGAGLRLRIERRTMWPFASGSASLGQDAAANKRVLECEVDQIERGSSVQELVGELEDAQQQRELDDLESTSGVRAATKPFREAFYRFKRGVSRVMGRDGFVNIYVDGKKYRADLRDGWVADGGYPLDRLLNQR